jgi:membrane associated rhomboid family serine protease
MFPIRDNVRARRAPFVTWVLIGLNVLVFVLQLGMPRQALEQAAYLFGVVPARLLHPRWARAVGYPSGALLTLFTSMFLHGGFFHLLTNLWALWLFGDNVEDRLGHLRYLVFYVLCGVGAMATHVFLQSASTIPAIGASGAIAGVMGAYLLFFPFARMIVVLPVFFYPLFFEVPAVIYLLLWFWTQIAGGASTLVAGVAHGGGIAFWAHVGGFFCGMVFSRVLCCNPRGRRRRYWERDEFFPW